MRQFSTRRRVHHGAEQMFDLVADVEHYPEFVPLCRELRILRRKDMGEGIEIITATMTVAYKMIHESFTSRVTLDRPNLKIFVEYINGPFSKLDNRWGFRPLAHSECEVEFYIAYEFRSRTLGMLMGTVFDTAFRKLASAFEHRADELFGRPAAQARA